MARNLALISLSSIGRVCAAKRPFLFPSTPFKILSRSATILKRRVPIPVAPRDQSMDYIMRNLDPLYEEYEVVEDTDEVEFPKIEVILKTYVEDVGKPGQRVVLDQMIAYQLIILGEAMYVTPENLSKMKVLTESELDKHSSLTAFKTTNMLRKKTLSVFMNMHEPWTIEPWHIRVNCRLAGVHILSDECIELPEKPITGPNLDWEGKDFVTTIIINNCERVPIRCRLRHYTKIFNQKIILPPDHEYVPSDPIFSDQEELLKSIPLPVYVDPSTLPTAAKKTVMKHKSWKKK